VVQILKDSARDCTLKVVETPYDRVVLKYRKFQV
jgi:hypothetical protein